MTRSIFRAAALQRYIQSQEQPVLPRLATPRVFPYLWVLLGLLVMAGFTVWLTPVPIYTSGLGIVSVEGTAQTNPGEPVLIAFLPPDTRTALRAGQQLSIQLSSTGERLNVPVIEVSPAVVSPAEARQQFHLGEAALAIVQPSAVAVARLEATSTGLPDSAYLGSVFRIDVEIGSRRALSLLPVIGHFFE